MRIVYDMRTYYLISYVYSNVITKSVGDSIYCGKPYYIKLSFSFIVSKLAAK